MRDEVLERLRASRIIAIVRLTRGGDLVAVAEALFRGGVTVVEFTMTTPGALEAVTSAAETLGDRVVFGMGTVLDGGAARAAIAAGARFVVSPVLRDDVVAACRRYGVPCIPGAFTPSEMLRAVELGADLVKLFPAGPVGPSYVRDVVNALPQIGIVPTGGVNVENAAAFLAAGAVAVGVGSALVDRAVVERGDYAELVRRAERFRQALADA
ncbi:MAG TPA: bifunctional 4-hydroxy-2-oxoglutarate aldolase/2-dehydro-3-deoxy-phosphogluconate aldolase [Chloroflexota bacterium]